MSIYANGAIIQNRYNITKMIGEGGMQEVYLAYDSTFKRDVALKVPKNASAEKRFRRSAILSARVNHPNVAKTLDFFDEGGEHLIEEYVDGIDLRKFLDKFYRIDPFLAAHIFHHLVKGIAAAHHVGVFHRDLKPSNAMVSSGVWPKKVKITDFGIARMAEGELEELLEQGIEKSITTSQTLVGALPYMAPELISAPKKASMPADVWSGGAMLYEMISGEKPFGDGLPAVTRIIKGELPCKPNVLGSINQFEACLSELWAIVLDCFKNDPDKRLTADRLVERCSDLCYSIQRRSVGRIRRYGKDVGAFGFIRPRSVLTDVFFHRDSYYGLIPKEDEWVAFASYASGSGAPRAFPVVPLRGPW